MAKRKAELLDSSDVNNSTGSKKTKQEPEAQPSAIARANLLVESDSESDDGENGGGLLADEGFRVNKEYASRFEYNKKSAERRQLEDKFDKGPKKGDYGDKYDEDSDSSDPEDEDDDGFLATEDLDAEISATLQAIKNKDPALYNPDVTFYKPIDDAAGPSPKKAAKKMTLQDYHRANVTAGRTGAEHDDEDEEVGAHKTFVQEQEDLKESVVREMHAAAAALGDDDDSDSGFVKRKEKQKRASSDKVHPSRARQVKIELDPTTADQDPETYLSNFMTARAWVPTNTSRFVPLESDDDDEDDLADSYEQAYNQRFEDPTGSNEVLKTFARDITASRSVRREEHKGRKKQRELERERKEIEKQERHEERGRLRKLKIEEMEERLQKIKKAAGIKATSLKDDEWTKFLDDNWDDQNWENEMNKKFGEDYYAQQDMASESEAETSGKTKHKVTKPAWDDDIDIKDLVPGFVDEQDGKPDFLSSEDEEDGEDNDATTNKKASKAYKIEKAARRKAARLERQKIEELVDNKMDIDDISLTARSNRPVTFRYRDTSPSAYGLTARDILMADDTALNAWAGLKKLASFRDVEKKRKDKKRLSKKARLREWRKETFGNEDGPEVTIAPKDDTSVMAERGDVVEGQRKKRRPRKSKVANVEA